MNRREFIGGATVAAATLAAPQVRAQVIRDGAVDVAERFGFVPDGRADNYEAFHRLAAFATQSGGGNFLFPRGDYRVGPHRSTDFKSRDPREVINPHWERCDGLTISGVGARILLNGRFNRAARVGRDGLAVGMHAATFMPFEIRHCRNVVLHGFEIDGGVRDMTREEGVTEAYAALIALNGCRNVTLADLDLHHCQTDAIYLSDDVHNVRARGVACRDIIIERVRCSNNARGALAVIQAYGVHAVDSSFNGSAFGTGRYGRHAPGFGVDVEPDRYLPEHVDTRTGNLEFVNCELRDNFSAFLAAYVRKYQGYLRLIDCRSSNANNTPNHMIFAWPGAVISGGEHEAGDGTIWTSWSDQAGSETSLRDCTVRSSGRYGLFHAFEGGLTRLERVRLIGIHREAGPGSFPAIEADPGGGRKNLVRECEFFLPAARKSRDHAYDLEPSFNHCRCEANLFRTDLPATGGQHFATQYSPGTTVVGDTYRGTAPGPADSFRPAHNSSHDTRLPFSRP